jgi:U3 small nucleolar RNA-associated protein 18
MSVFVSFILDILLRCLFQVDGHTNPHLQTVHIPSLPITGAIFHPSGASILSTGPRPFYYSFDLQSGAVTRSAVKSVTSNNGDLSMEVCQFSPSGNILAVAGKHGYIHLLDWSASGGEQVIASLKSNSPVTALTWSASGNHLFSLGRASEVLVWDIAGRQCLNKWTDEGGFGSRHMSLDIKNSYLSIGWVIFLRFIGLLTLT